MLPLSDGVPARRFPVVNACRAPEPWGISWITAMFPHGSWDHILGDAFLAAWVPTIMAACCGETSASADRGRELT